MAKKLITLGFYIDHFASAACPSLISENSRIRPRQRAKLASNTRCVLPDNDVRRAARAARKHPESVLRGTLSLSLSLVLLHVLPFSLLLFHQGTRGAAVHRGSIRPDN